MPLVFVPTPLGNLRDVTLRALDALREAELIVAEDTRVARKLLRGLGIEGREIWSYREQNADRIVPQILERARASFVAVTSDAGMPGISDPGSELIAAAREAGLEIDVLPGPSAATGVALLSGFSLSRFAFEGFPPRTRAARRARFAQALGANATTIWYESPHRVAAALSDLAAVAPDARVFFVREYTKLHEQRLTGTPEQIVRELPQPVRGEVAFAVAPYRAAPAAPSFEATEAAIDLMLAQEQRPRDIAKRLAAAGAGDRRALYLRATARKAHQKGPIKEPS
ncbi:MAG: 16S rRNA (cytidine(1402)-2'-O)-methyltransferase [Candidatus Eremiobacteraeota bacterium]|nr:16S rRNA (cytidine(1402)-2'-O)-methyltransferase [Candidatus Eremiobacteraeota bacterium]